MDPVVIVIVIAVVVIIVAVLAVVALSRRRKSARLQERFGPEYDRAVDARGGARQAEDHLHEVADRRDQLDVRPLEPAARDGYVRRWESVQATFVDRPDTAVEEADRLITEVMDARGYPVEDFDQRAELIAADHPHVVEHYRAAHVARHRQLDSAGSDTEELRRAFTHYRALFEQLVHDGATEDRDARQRPER